MRFTKNKSRISQDLKVNDIRAEEKSVSQCIAYTLISFAIVLFQVRFSKLSNIQFFKFYYRNKYKIIQDKPIKELLVRFFVFITLVYKLHNEQHLTNS